MVVNGPLLAVLWAFFGQNNAMKRYLAYFSFAANREHASFSVWSLQIYDFQSFRDKLLTP